MPENNQVTIPAKHLLGCNAFRDFPWQNGCILRGPQIEADVTRWVREEPSQYPGIDSTILTVRKLSMNLSPNQLHCELAHRDMRMQSP
jgi:hypothetical protein